MVPTLDALATSPPNLPTEEQATFMVNLLTDNQGCDLPCWWGIEPGRTSWNDAQRAWASIDHLTTVRSQAEGSVRYDVAFSIESNGVPNLLLRFQVDAGIVNRIYVFADNLNSPPDSVGYAPGFTAAMQRYSIRPILSHHGVPSEVILGLRAGPVEAGAPWMYALLVAYEPQGIAVYNRGEGMATSGDLLRVCPREDQVHLIQLNLQSAQSTSPVMEFVNETQHVDEKHADGTFQSFEAATELSLHNLVELLSPNVGNSCFESPASLWH
jgi:hypothetical protein